MPLNFFLNVLVTNLVCLWGYMVQGEEQSFQICPLMGAGNVGNSAWQEAAAAAAVAAAMQSSKQGCLDINEQKVTETKTALILAQ